VLSGSKKLKKRPFILTIAGFDPSSGAGLTADIKTMEQLKCYGLAVCTANTVQDDRVFMNCYWTPLAVIKEQIAAMFVRFQIPYVKIGIIENWDVLKELIDFLLLKNPQVKIVLDPILKTSTHVRFHTSNDKILEDILCKVYLITPNYEELQELFSNKDIKQTIQAIQAKTHVLIKGGHRKEALGQDLLYTKDHRQYVLNPKMTNCSEKHGSGCILSAAITSYLALGFPLLKACYRGKQYTAKVLCSNQGLLGYHGKG
jgi:hydroxymethylpyrimidine/phosphomethylpyrimidine kinase